MKILSLTKKICIASLVGLLVLSSAIPNSYAQNNSQQNDLEIVPMANHAINLSNLTYGSRIPVDLGWLDPGDVVSVTSSSWYPSSVRLTFGLKHIGGNSVSYLSNSGDTRSFTVSQGGNYQFFVENFNSSKITVGSGNISFKY